ncbi:hypothetical protein CCAL9344_07960 [Campylobacter sp. RM9344]|uniref:Uncharacterized protein n=1 Tax=Campylobacter californiensis TaxID=1032243 RepID=A0AAW3ZWB6_9BACT|nr:hypothetical protein [Campylobacter sp. RM9337]MBE3030112.1 hypothetical protein [Campylobacter sp. RM9344]MBE3608768.1 hypothetical protein [Campylobacter sp. RM9337]
MDFFEFLKKAGNTVWDWLGNTDKAGTTNWLTATGTGGALYGAYNQQKQAKKALKMQEDAYNFNKMLSQREIDRQNRAEQNLYDAWNKSSYSRI